MFKAKPAERAAEAEPDGGDDAGGRRQVTLNTGIDLVYLIAVIGFILALKGLSSPKHARNGNLLGAAAAARGRRLHLRLPGGPGPHRATWSSSSGGHGHRRGHRRAGGPHGEDDRDAPDGGHLQRRRWRCRRPGLDRRVFLIEAPGKPAVYQIAEVLFGVLVGSRVLLRERDRLRQAAGADDRPARSPTRPSRSINAVVGRGHRWRWPSRPLVTGSVPLLVGDRGAVAGARGHLRAAHRRRRRAGAHLAAQLVHRPGRGRLGLHPRQQPADRRRHPGRRLGHPAHPDDEQGHGPVAGQHPVQRLRLGGHRRRRRRRLGRGPHRCRSGTPEDIGVLLAYARKVVIIPGYGLAVAQAQHTARELADLLMERGVEVFYAIHPVAGRMPGHMNVLLAEANVPYDQLKEMDEANPEMSDRRRRPGGRGQRHGEPGGQEHAGQPHLRHADHQRRRGREHRLPQALDAPGLRRHRQRAALRREDDPAVRRRQGHARQAGGRGQSGLRAAPEGTGGSDQV